MADIHPKASRKTLKNPDLKRAASSPRDQPTKKQPRKGENPVRIPPPTELTPDIKYSCGLSCHIECALQCGKVGVVNLGQLMQLDGSYCCASCGKVSGILGYWKKQLTVAKEARRVDILCYRIFLSHRLLDGTSRFKELHELTKEAKAKLETEVGPLNGVSSKMGRGIVSRLSVAGDVQTICSLAIEKADELLASKSSATLNCIEDSLPAACKFLFEEVTSSSVVVILIELSTASSNDIKGYKLWYCKTREETHGKEPVCVFPRSQRRIWISNLQPCTEYSFRIISYTEAGDFGHSEARCFTKSVEIIHKNFDSVSVNYQKQNSDSGGSPGTKTLQRTETDIELDSGFKVRDLGKILRLACVQEQGGFRGFCGLDIKKGCRVCDVKPETLQEDRLPSFRRGLDLNVASVPDLNEEFTPPVESSRDEDGCGLGQGVEAEDDAFSHDLQRNGLARSHGSGDSHNWNHGNNREVPAVDSQVEAGLKRARISNGEMQDSDSTLTNGSQLQVYNGPGSLDENFEYCVKIIRWLECEGHINQEFRLKLLTWFSLRSTEQERRVVNTFIQTLIDDPSSLAGQLVDSFSDIVSSKTPRNGFCSELWH
ncbi:VIN3-like protein 1 [Abeliophyllum distichum]|uniref:VIN3-like protein 1 n=1 Tax=Abeliophyllum distichum TaxID=126358 RepID=A0ABD1SGI4_9LAMI